MTNDNFRPSVHREIKVHEKRVRTLDSIDSSLKDFAMGIKDAMISCPFTHDTTEIQHVVNAAATWCSGFSETVTRTRNYVLEQHLKDMKTLVEVENDIPTSGSKNLDEDSYAMMKTGLVDELTASRTVRNFDEKTAKAFSKKLHDLETEFLGPLYHPETANLDNKGSEHYSLVE